MRISFIGAGRVAHHLSHELKARHQIVQVYSRTKEHAQGLAKKVGAQAVSSFKKLDAQIDVLIIAVSDSSIADVIENVHPHLPNTLIVHTSGSTDLAKLTQVHKRAGVFYPLQTFSFEREVDWSNTPIFTEATHVQDLSKLTDLANELSQRVYEYDSAQRLSLHLAAVFACNFSNYCYDMAKQVVDAKNVDFSLLYPLILETANKATVADPKIMQTGPAMRQDQNILNMHQQILQQDQRIDLAKVYELMSEQVLKRHSS